MRKKLYEVVLISLLAIVLLVSCNTVNTKIPNTNGKESNGSKIPADSELIKKEVEGRANETILALKNKDMTKLSSIVHPVKGVRFTPYTNVKDSDLTFQSNQIKDFMKNSKKYIWGSYQGSGEPIINMTPMEYYNKFIYNADFASAKTVTFNKPAKDTGIVENQFEFYPNSNIIEYYIPEIEPKNAGMDWASLRLVFEKYNENWYLVGIIHNQWTP